MTIVVFASSIAHAADAFKTSKGQVVVTGLTPTKRYQIRTIDLNDKLETRPDKSVNNCGEIVVERADKYKTLIVGS